LSTIEETTFSGWAIVELMGHQRTAGKIGQGSVGGLPAMRLDVYVGNANEPVTQFFTSGTPVYRITPSTEEICRRVAAANVPQPVHEWQLPALPASSQQELDYDDPGFRS